MTASRRPSGLFYLILGGNAPKYEAGFLAKCWVPMLRNTHHIFPPAVFSAGSLQRWPALNKATKKSQAPKDLTCKNSYIVLSHFKTFSFIYGFLARRLTEYFLKILRHRFKPGFYILPFIIVSNKINSIRMVYVSIIC